MQSITLKCRVITPMFMAGADGKTPELRPSEFKGMMRFWWRALRANDNIEELRKEEARIFGGTGEGEGKSKVRIIVKPISSLSTGTNLKNNFNLNWRYNPRERCLEGEDSGIGYLLYSTVLPKKERAYIKPNCLFNLTISSTDEEAFKNALAPLWASIYLGGFGTRARRGGGNVVVENVAVEEAQNDLELDFIPKGNSTDDLFNWLKNNTDVCISIINKGEIKNFCTRYSNLSFSRIIISNQNFTDWKSALNGVGEIYFRFRNNHKRNFPEIAVFGLPVIYRDKTKIEGFKKEKKFSRRNSPIIFKVIRIQDKFFWYVLRLSGEFLEEGSVIRADNRNEKPDYRLIDEFWNELKNSGKEFILTKPKILGEIVEKIKKELDPDRIILFGSRARGDAHKNADIDIAVENPKNPISSSKIYGPVDIVNLNKANSTLQEKIRREGIIIP